MTLLFWRYAAALAYPVVLFTAAEIFCRRNPSEDRMWFVRKYVHILLSVEWFILYSLFNVGLHFLIVCLIILLLIGVAVGLKLITNLVASGSKFSYGTVYYALSLVFLAAVTVAFGLDWAYFSFVVCCMCLGDGFAGLFGTLAGDFSPKLLYGKTLVGTLTDFVISFLACLAANYTYGYNFPPYTLLLVAYVSAFAELLFTRGLDNYSVPLSVFATAFIFITYPQSYSYVCGILLIPPVAAVVIKKRALTFWGAALGLAFAVTILAIGKNPLFCIFVAYYALAVVADAIGARKKERVNEQVLAKTSRRDVWQVLVNGFFPCLSVVLYAVLNNSIFIFCFFACLAESLADTFASEIGVLSRRGCVDICTFKKIDAGLSGGVSAVGTLAAAFGSVIVASLFAFFTTAYWQIPLIALFGFAGCVLDSVLGSRLQIAYRCRVCGTLTERALHCGVPAQKVKGYGVFTNDVVNAISSAFAFSLGLLLLAL